MTSRSPRLDAVTARWRSFAGNDQVVLSALAAVIGVAVGYGAIGFRLLLASIQEVFYGFSSQQVATLADDLAWWHVLFAPAAGGLVVGLLLRFLVPGRRAEGVAQVMEAGALRGGRLTPGKGLAVAAVSVASLGAGASAGREGPVVHLGATAASFVAQRLKFGPSLSLTLLGCGVASAVAASFNAPIAGAFFALEVVIGHYALHAFSPIVIASVAGAIVSRIHLGDFPAFVLPDYSIVSFFELPAFLMLGIVCAAVAMIFMWSIMFAADAVEHTRTPIWLRPAIGGLGVGAIAVFFPEVLGVGYEATGDALKGIIPLGFLIFPVIGRCRARPPLRLMPWRTSCHAKNDRPRTWWVRMLATAMAIIAATVTERSPINSNIIRTVEMGAPRTGAATAPMPTTA